MSKIKKVIRKSYFTVYFIRYSCLFLGMATTSYTFSADRFNIHALEIDNPEQLSVDLTEFAEKGRQAAGVYRVALYLNKSKIAMRDIDFQTGKDGLLHAQFTSEDFAKLGVKTDAFPSLREHAKDQPLDDISLYIPSAKAVFDFDNLRFDLSIPQSALNTTARDQIDESDWDAGIPAILINYDVSGDRTRKAEQHETENNFYINSTNGINMGAWRLRNQSSYSRESQGKATLKFLGTYVQRNITSLKSSLTLGDGYTPSDVFDGISIRGMQIMSDNSMLADSLKGFSPVIHGIANSSAKVTIEQNGYSIYQTYVPPGPFTISDLFSTSGSGDLKVIITESDGSEHVFIQPYASVPIMQREGNFNYSFSTGKYRAQAGNIPTPYFSQITGVWGLPYNITLYGGGIVSNAYKSVAAGLGVSLGEAGAVSADVTHANSELTNGNKYQGESYRLRYAKSFPDMGTNLSFSAYGYSHRAFYNFSKATEMCNSSYAKCDYESGNEKEKFQLELNQSLYDYGSIFVSAYQQSYWGWKGVERGFSGGYNKTYNGISYSLSYTYSKSTLEHKNAMRQISLNIQIPLGGASTNLWSSYNIANSSNGRTLQQVGINGTALPDNNLSYSVRQMHQNHQQGDSGNLNGSYTGSSGEVNLGYNQDPDSKQLNYKLQGGIVAHQGGITLSQPLGQTVTLVRAKGAENVRIQSNRGLSTDWRGFAVVPYQNPYHRNTISLDTSTFGDRVDIESTIQSAIPTLGAVTAVDFNAKVGHRVLMTLDFNKKPVPFGSTVSIIKRDEEASIVGDDGEVYLSGVPDEGVLRAKWGNGENQQCKLPFDLRPYLTSEKGKSSAVVLYKGECV